MEHDDYPALFKSADISSNKAQSSYLKLIKFEYGLLFLAAVIALSLRQEAVFLYVLALIASSGLLIFMSIKKPEKDWYGCRALAESIKTSSWRYMMRAEPFEDVPKLKEVNDKFREFLIEILEVNKHLRDSIVKHPDGGDQISPEMIRIRGIELEERKSIYLRERIKEQRKWYINKAIFNKKQFSKWIIICVVVQVTAIILALLRIKYGDIWAFWPTEPLLVLSAAIVGWIQIKKFNELASAYSLTAHEIGIIESRISDIIGEEDFSEFVNEAELAFSREHTQWIARQQD
tara:strand:- start:21277 stop:22146 length:870 start_codon:yes stop_codon:yes gene_type:complete